MGVVTIVAVGLFGAAALAQSTASIKGIYVDAAKPGVKVLLYAVDGETERQVDQSHRFVSGDRLVLKVEANQESYVYVINRTLRGNTDQMAAQGIDRIREDDRQPGSGGSNRSRQKYSLVYPSRGQVAKIPRGRLTALPRMRMDDEPGVEKMFVVLSKTPIKIGDYFDLDTGEQRQSPDSGGGRNDSRDDVLDQLNKSLSDWGRNLSSGKGIELEPYGVVVDEGKPGMKELTLKHYRR